MWAPDRTQWFLIWIGFLLASYAVVCDSIGGALFLASIFALLIYYRETLRRARKAEAETELRNERLREVTEDVTKLAWKPYEEMTKDEKIEAELRAEWAFEDWKRKRRQ